MNKVVLQPTKLSTSKKKAKIVTCHTALSDSYSFGPMKRGPNTSLQKIGCEIKLLFCWTNEQLPLGTL